ncbi:hypothetical protein BXU09_18475 [Deinococcus sp. LM3]|nr:hypothetical protein BXU09_18475 [Deinococcus sp. LM3]
MTSMAMLHARRGEWRQYGQVLTTLQGMTDALEDVEIAPGGWRPDSRNTTGGRGASRRGMQRCTCG